MTNTKTIHLADCSPFLVPPECAGQMVELAYASCSDGIVRRVTDRSDRETRYEWADWDDVDGEFSPQNVEPTASEWRQAIPR